MGAPTRLQPARGCGQPDRYANVDAPKKKQKLSTTAASPQGVADGGGCASLWTAGRCGIAAPASAGDRRPMASSAKICADPLDRRVASVQGVHRPGHLLQLALVGLYWQ